MCWNSKISLNTFLIGLGAISLGYINGYSIYFVIFFISFILMQLVEHFLWIYYDDPNWNNIFTQATFWLIVIQPIFAILLMKEQNEYLMKLFLASYILLLSFYIGFSGIYNSFRTMYSYKGHNNHLVWNWINKDNINIFHLILYSIFFFIPILLAKEYGIFLFVFITFFISIYSFWKYDTWASLWCWFCNITSLFIIITLMFDYDKPILDIFTYYTYT